MYMIVSGIMNDNNRQNSSDCPDSVLVNKACEKSSKNSTADETSDNHRVINSLSLNNMSTLFKTNILVPSSDHFPIIS